MKLIVCIVSICTMLNLGLQSTRVKEKMNCRHLVLLCPIFLCVVYHMIMIDLALGPFSDFEFNFRQQEIRTHTHISDFATKMSAGSQKSKLRQENKEILNN